MSLSLIQLLGPPPAQRDTIALRAYAIVALVYRTQYLNAPCATSYYFDYAAGNDGNAGTEASPFKTIAKAQAMHDAWTSTTARLGLFFKRGVEFVSATGLSITKSDVTVGEYGSAGAAKPLLHCFTLALPIGGGGWTADGAHYKRSVTTAVVEWISKVADRLTPMSRLASAAEVDANANSFWYDTGAQELHVNVGADPDTIALEGVYRNAVPGVEFKSTADRCVCRNLRGDGWGNDSGTVRQVYSFMQSGSTTQSNHVLFYGCEGYRNGVHSIGQYAGGASDLPQYSTYVNCVAGFGYLVGSTDYTAFVGYQQTGGNEVIFANCRTAYGRLPTAVVHQRAGSPLKTHTGGGANKIGLVISLNCISDDGTYGCTYLSSFSDNPTTSYRCFVIGERMTVSSYAGGQLFTPGTARINCDYNLTPNPGAVADLGGGGSGVISGEVLGCQITINLANIVVGKYTIFNTSATGNAPVMIGCHLHVIGNGTTFFQINWDTQNAALGAATATGSIFCNNIYSVVNPGATVPTIGMKNDPAALRGNRLYGVAQSTNKEDGYNLGVNNVVLDDLPVMGRPPVPGDPFHGVGDTLYPVTGDFDSRPRNLSAPCIGPVETWNGYVGGGTQGGMIRKVRR